nr:MAG TPA: hypothetical protein [Ackermannviridae sp.]
MTLDILDPKCQRRIAPLVDADRTLSSVIFCIF